MENPVKKVAAIHDLSGLGRSSLSAVIPILSCMGIQVCPFPTAILSSNTAGYKDFSFVDLTTTMEEYLLHWKKTQVKFDCIYSGFLGSGNQVDIILKFIESFKTEFTLLVVDPVLGDEGKLYPTINKDLVEKIRILVSKADIITPNLTEAIYLLGEEYSSNFTESEIKEILLKLSNLGPDIVIITSVPDISSNDKINVYAYDKSKDLFLNVRTDYINVNFLGTGDAFTSVIIGSLLMNDSLETALNKSVNFILNGIKESCKYDYLKREGILIEKILHTLHS
ncbi:MAG: pyridoxamine kinase [Tissierellaceae bacterium]|nr:pyridoxamine kinase [Tissierellaceae bacterium]